MSTPIKVIKCRVRGQIKWAVDLRRWKQGRLFFPTEALANRAALARQVEVEQFGAGALTFTHEARSDYEAATSKLSVVGATLSEAVEFFLVHRRGLVEMPVIEAIEAAVTAKKQGGRRPEYVRNFASHLKWFADALTVTHCHGVTHGHIESWMDLHSDWSPKTRLNNLVDVRTFFSYCRKRRWVTHDPSAAFEKIQCDAQAPGILTVAQCRALLDNARSRTPSLLPFLAIQLFGGLRASEARRIGWDDVKEGHVNVSAAASKTRERRLVTLNDTLRAWLSLGGNLPVANWRRQLERAKGTGTLRRPVRLFEFQHNCLRHTFCSYALPVHGAAWTANEAGHSEGILFKHYREIVTKQDAEAFWRLRP